MTTKTIGLRLDEKVLADLDALIGRMHERSPLAPRPERAAVLRELALLGLREATKQYSASLDSSASSVAPASKVAPVLTRKPAQPRAKKPAPVPACAIDPATYAPLVYDPFSELPAGMSVFEHLRAVVRANLPSYVPSAAFMAATDATGLADALGPEVVSGLNEQLQRIFRYAAPSRLVVAAPPRVAPRPAFVCAAGDWDPFDEAPGAKTEAQAAAEMQEIVVTDLRESGCDAAADALAGLTVRTRAEIVAAVPVEAAERMSSPLRVRLGLPWLGGEEEEEREGEDDE